MNFWRRDSRCVLAVVYLIGLLCLGPASTEDIRVNRPGGGGQIYEPNSEKPLQRPWMDNHMAATLHELQAQDIEKEDFDFKTLKGKAVLISNVASHCGFTESHYQGFKELDERFGDKLVIMAFPCNQFGSQEPGTNAEIQKFAEGKGFPGVLMDKINVNGSGLQHPVFKFLKESSGDVSPIPWNFNKFLVRPDGTVHGRYRQDVDIMSLEKDIAALVHLASVQEEL